MVKSENHNKCLCIDYSRTINGYKQLDAYLLPRIHDMVTKLARYMVFSTLDLKLAYHQIPIWEEGKAYTAFEGMANSTISAGSLLELPMEWLCSSAPLMTSLTVIN